MHNTHAQQLADYIKKNLKKGYTMDSLKYSLISQGYSKISVENAIDLANKQLATEIPEMNERPEITVKIYDEPTISESPNPTNNPPQEITNEPTKKKSFWNNLFE